MTRISLFASLLLAVVMVAGCPEPSASPTAGGATKGPSVPAGSPSEAVLTLQKAAKANDVKGFKAGLSKNFVLTIERLQEISGQKSELKGAFRWETFMSTLGNKAPKPTEEVIQGNKARVKAVASNGSTVITDMVLEDGRRKREVPGGIVKALDNLDHMARLAKGEQIDPEADINRGGGGKGGRLKALPPDADDAAKAKAAALDAFDMGDVTGSRAPLEKAFAANPDDEELAVAVGRAQVQLGDGDMALKTFTGYLKKNPKSVKAKHYLGMAYMMKNKPIEAAKEWRDIGQIDPEYARLNQLPKRAAIAEGIAQGKTPQEAAAAAGALKAPAGGAPGGGAASQPK